MHKILVIDDDELFLEIVIALLSKTGWQTISANDGQLGLQLAKEQMPDLIICDIRMRGFNGYQVLNALRQDQQTQKIPMFFFTATLTDKDRQAASELGVDCIDKFRIFNDLIKTIQSQIK